MNGKVVIICVTIVDMINRPSVSIESHINKLRGTSGDHGNASCNGIMMFSMMLVFVCLFE